MSEEEMSTWPNIQSVMEQTHWPTHAHVTSVGGYFNEDMMKNKKISTHGNKLEGVMLTSSSSWSTVEHTSTLKIMGIDLDEIL